MGIQKPSEEEEETTSALAGLDPEALDEEEKVIDPCLLFLVVGGAFSTARSRLFNSATCVALTPCSKPRVRVSSTLVCFCVDESAERDFVDALYEEKGG